MEKGRKYMKLITEPLNREQMIDIIEGKGSADRIPMVYHFWIGPERFPDAQKYQALLDQYPSDVQAIPVHIPEIFDAPADDPSYRWAWRDGQGHSSALDNAGFIEDWETELDDLINDFPDPNYHGLTSTNPAPDGRYRLGNWWYFFFERLWSMRGMENALMDFYLYPDEIHRLFDKLTDFYIRMLERCKNELHLDGIFTSDDLGTQTSPFFSPDIFKTFFLPYYKRVISAAHDLGMHFWLHTCGNVEMLIPYLIEAGVDVLHPIQKYTMDEKKIAGQYGNDITIWAGFDVQRTIPYGTPDDVRKEVRYLIDTYTRKDGRFILTLGNNATADTPYSSLEALLDETVTYGRKKISLLQDGV